MNKRFTLLVLGLLALLPMGCVANNLAKKEDVDFVETSVNREVSALRQQLDLANSRSEESVQRINSLKRSTDERLGMIEQQMQQQEMKIEALQKDLEQAKAELNKTMDAKMETLLDAIVKENQKVVQQINKRSSGSSASSSAAKKPAAVPQPAAEGGTDKGFYHTIERGQTISQISSLYGVSIDDILQANELTDANKLSVGQQIFIPKKDS